MSDSDEKEQDPRTES